jgi:hypothetical protein
MMPDDYDWKFTITVHEKHGKEGVAPCRYCVYGCGEIRWTNDAGTAMTWVYEELQALEGKT